MLHWDGREVVGAGVGVGAAPAGRKLGPRRGHLLRSASRPWGCRLAQRAAGSAFGDSKIAAVVAVEFLQLKCVVHRHMVIRESPHMYKHNHGHN